MSATKSTVRVKIKHFTGRDEGDVGYPYYVASSNDLMFTTDGTTFEELLANVRECLILCLKDTDSIVEYNVAPDARVELIMELPKPYAEIA